MKTAILGAITASLAAVIVLRLVIRRRLLVKYAALWLSVSVVLVTLAVIPGAVETVSQGLGFEVPANLLFFTGFMLLLFVNLQTTVELTKVEAKQQRLAEELAIMRDDADGYHPPEP